MKSIIDLTNGERRPFIQRADSAGIELGQPTLYLWAALAGLSLVLGLVWRLTGNAPPIPAALDALGLVLWLTAPWLAPAWDRLLRRQRRHVQPRRDPWSWRLANTGYLLLVSLILSLAPAALLLGFSIKDPTALPYLADDYTLNLPVGVWLIGILLLVGPILIIVSTLLMHLAHLALPWRWALAGWLGLTVVFNAPLVLGGLAPLVLNNAMTRVPLSIGQYASWVGTQVASSQADQLYWHELLGRLVSAPLAALVLALIAATLLQEPVRRLATRTNAVWLTALGSVAAVAARAAWQGWQWSSNPARSFPGDWLNLMYTGLIAAWLIWGMMMLRRDCERPTSWPVLGWLLFTAGAWVCLTLAHRVAGQVAAAKLLLAGAAAAVLLICGVALIYRIAGAAWPRARGFRPVATTLILAALLLPLPLGDTHISLSHWAFRLLTARLSPDQIPGVGLYVLAGLVLLCVLIWPFSRRPRLSAEPASPSAAKQ